MNLYGSDDIKSIEEIAKSNAIQEMFLVDDVLHGSEAQIKQFCESEEAKVLTEKTVLNKPTLMRLSKTDDQKRRVKLIAYQLAKENNDPEWNKLKKYTALRKQSIRKIMKKYGKKAERVAKVAQKEYIKNSKSVKATASEKRAQQAR
jgi:hypothetical protein